MRRNRSSQDRWMAHPAVQAFLKSLKRRSQRTVSSHTRSLQDFAEWLAQRGKPLDPRMVLPQDLEDYRHHLLAIRRLSPTAIRRHMAALRAFLDFSGSSPAAPEDCSPGPLQPPTETLSEP